jgi:hypothetical protein
VSSANFTEAGQHRNIEVGLLLSCQMIAERITGFFNRLAEEAHLERALSAKFKFGRFGRLASVGSASTKPGRVDKALP